MFLHLAASSPVSMSPQAPPFAGGVQTAIHWLSWGIAAVAVAAVAVQGARLVWARQQGSMGVSEHGAGLGWTVLGLTIIGSAGAIVGALT